MSCLIITSAACLEHVAGPHHPERPDRLRAVLKGLQANHLKQLPRQDAPRATEEQLGRVHTAAHIKTVLEAVPSEGHASLDPDTWLCPDSGEAGLRAAGAVVLAVDQVMAGPVGRAFCAIRPPGHHAEAAQAMGFCLFNNIAVGAAHALAQHALTRVAIIDFDVHHGNGTAAIFASDPRVLYVSSHQWPLYPGTGAVEDAGVGNLVNGLLTPGGSRDEFRDLYRQTLLPRIDEFAPELIFISAGFDAHRDDPLAGMNLHPDDYRWLTDELVAMARRHAGGRIISALEGGYDLGALEQCSRVHVEALAS